MLPVKDEMPRRRLSKQATMKVRKVSKVTSNDGDFDLEDPFQEKSKLSKMFSQLDKAEKRREQEALVEEEEIGYREDVLMEENENKSQKTDNDSEYSDGELKGNEKHKIFKSIINSLNEYEKMQKKPSQLKKPVKKPPLRRVSV